MHEIKVKNNNANYSILIGNKILNILNVKLKKTCPKALKIAIVVDKNIPAKFLSKIKNNLKNYKIFTFKFNSSEKSKSQKTINFLLKELLTKGFNRTDVVIGLGGGITGDVSGFVASILKRGINFINIPTTLLSQVDSSIGGKTGINSNYGKNLVGAFYQPKLVISDVSFLKTLPQREIICGYAEVLKHGIIADSKFFSWLNNNSKNILKERNINDLIYAINKSCKIKLNFVNKDVHERGLRMTLNFGHTFAHAIETKNNYSKNINHGEAVLIGMVIATKLSFQKKVCTRKTLDQIIKIYNNNDINYNLKKYFTTKDITNMLKYMKNDKKNYDEKINLILLKKIGKTTKADEYKVSISNIKKYLKKII
jgi:3-dehydroquinate synthase|tara:strand:+ start:578 stop:1681 length:1104 start_codon:yes stop_codon:yes gene_type:complete